MTDGQCHLRRHQRPNKCIAPCLAEVLDLNILELEVRTLLAEDDAAGGDGHVLQYRYGISTDDFSK